jgi:hypothetical protein
MSAKYIVGWVARVMGILYASTLALSWWDEMQAQQS